MTRSFDMTILDDIEIEVTFSTTGYDNTDVGGGDNDVDEWFISNVYSDNPLETIQWVSDQLTDTDEDTILETCRENID